jgi:hypothetical protein
VSFQGDVDRYKKNLEQFFFYLYKSTDMNARCSKIAEQSGSIYSKLRSIKDGDNWSLSISPPLNMPIENDEDLQTHEGCLLVGGRVVVEKSKLVFHSISICIVINDKIARRFHFDVAAGDAYSAKPKCHLQYGGDARHELEFMVNLSHDLDPWLKKPRFPYPPIDIVLLFDLLLRQVETAVGRKFVKEPYWKKIVKKSERIAMKSYYDTIHKYFDSETKDTLLETLSQ